MMENINRLDSIAEGNETRIARYPSVLWLVFNRPKIAIPLLIVIAITLHIVIEPITVNNLVQIISQLAGIPAP
jgi:hypothetical protein